MTTGFNAPAGDLDTVFAARTSAAIANTGFRSNGGVDLAQRFEPRADTTPAANTGFVSGSSDLALLFKSIAAGTVVSGNMTAGQNSFLFGYQSSAGGATPYGSCTIGLVGVNTLLAINFNGSAGNCSVIFGHASVSPADADTTWERIEVTGTFADSGSGTRTLKRSAASGSGTASGGGLLQRSWQLSGFGGPPPQFVNGNVYTVNIYRS